MVPRWLCVTAVGTALWACTDTPVDVAAPLASISDAVHDAGNPHFFWLPPMVGNPDAFNGDFDITVEPEVVICMWDVSSGDCSADLEIYTTVSGPGSETIRIDELEEHFVVNWHTNKTVAEHPLAVDQVYRLEARVGPFVLGHADVVPVANGREIRNVDTDELIPLVNGATLAVTFRIEVGALDQQEPGIDGGLRHSCALNESGQAYCWGYNEYGQLGTGSTSAFFQPTPQPVTGGHTFTKLATGWHHTCGLSDAGEIWCWGHGGMGQLGDGTFGYDRPAPVHAAAPGYAFVDVTGGSYHTCGLADTGEALCWGHNSQGQVGRGSVGGYQPTPAPVVGGHSFASVGAHHGFHTCGVTTTGEGLCWGMNFWGQLGIGSRTPGRNPEPRAVSGTLEWSAIETGYVHTCGIAASGAAYCWGLASSGQVGDGSFGSIRTAPRLVAGGHTFASVTGGVWHSCGVTSSSVALCWGSNQYGQLGIGSGGGAFASPQAVYGTESWLKVRPGGEHTCGLTTEGEVMCWGRNRYGQLGDGTTNTRPTPGSVTFPTS